MVERCRVVLGLQNRPSLEINNPAVVQAFREQLTTYQEWPENLTVRWLLCQHGEGLLAGEHETFVPGVLPRVAEPLVRAQNPGRGHVSLIREGRIDADRKSTRLNSSHLG